MAMSDTTAKPVQTARGLTNTHRLRIAIVVATAGRPEILPLMAKHWLGQTRSADAIVVAGSSHSDVGTLAQDFPGIEVIFGAKGLCLQRNAAIDHLGDSIDLVVFFDDDYVPSRRFVENLEALMLAHPNLAMVTGQLLADGIMGPGVAYEAARDMVARFDESQPDGAAPAFTMKPCRNAYGCNMVAHVALSPSTRFDPNLPLYAWLEDVDYSVRMRSFGPSVQCDQLVGVHMGVKSGRTPGRRMGYSQIANVVYLARKGSLSSFDAFELAAGNVLKNAVRAPFPEPWLDRAGRLKGNLIALRDWARGALHPQRMLDL